MVNFKIVHVNDGTNVAESIVYRFSMYKFNLSVKLYNLRRRTSLVAYSTSSSLSTVEGPDISVLLATPAMLEYLDEMVGDDRIHLINSLKTDQPALVLSFFVPVQDMKTKIISVFNNNELLWRFMDLGYTRLSFHQCMLELISTFDEGQEEMPVPTLKQYHVLPDKPVKAKDTVYILVEKNHVDSNTVQYLSVVFKDGCQLTATQIADYLYEFEIPESSESSEPIEVFTSNGVSLGTNTIKYRDKLHIFADAFNEILKLAKLPFPQTDEEVNRSVKADFLTSDENLSPKGDFQTKLAQWMKSVKIDKNNVNISLQLFAYFCAKCNFGTVVQSLLKQLPQPDQDHSLSKDESLEEDDGVEYSDDKPIEFLEVKDEDDASYSSGTAEDYVCPEDIIVEYRSHANYAINPGRKISTVSAVIPRTTQHICERENLSKSCPPDCSKHGHMSAGKEKPCYENVPVCDGLEAETYGNIIHESPARKKPEPRLEKSRKPSSLSESQASSTTIFNDPLTVDAEGRIILPAFSPEEIRPALPPRWRRDNSKQNIVSSSKSQHRLSLASLKPGSTPPSCIMSSSTLSLTKLCDSKTSVYGQCKVDSASRMLSRKSPSTLNSSTLSLPRLCGQTRAEYFTRVAPVTSPDGNTDAANYKLPPIPYSCRPSPPIPITRSHRMAHSYSASDCLSLTLRNNTLGRQKQNSAGDEESFNPENNSDDSCPDYSEPLELYFDDAHSHGFLRSSSMSEQEEVIYEKIDEISESFQEETLIDAAALYDVPRKGIHRCVSADVIPASPQSPVPTSPVSPDPPTSHKKSSSRSSPWSSFKLSLRKPGKSKKQNTKL